MNILNSLIEHITPALYTLPVLLVTITFHELAHGYTAYALGDPTAKEHGRLTLNPIKHIDLVGLLSLLILRFGWAKPVPYNPSYFNSRRTGTLLVAISGPLSNMLMAMISLLLLTFANLDHYIINMMIQLSFFYNITFAVFNLLPIPPLDGSKVLISLLPSSIEKYFWKYEKYGYVLLLILIFTGLLNSILVPIINITMDLFVRIVSIFL